MASTQNKALPIGHKLLDYEIKKVLNMGGFSYVYLAGDVDRNTVAIKEYLPTALALRADGINVTPSSPEASASFKHGLKCFFEEGRSLATINHKNIVRVLNFFRANDTVYMVMQYEHGKSLQESILRKTEPVSENFVRRIFSELLNGLREVHTRKLLHLDIKPANIFIRIDGTPVLLDFGSARQTLNNVQSKVAPSYTPGFASPEQHVERNLLGPWSDIYSVGATMYACLARAAPMSADLRLNNDLLVPAVKLGKGTYSRNLLELIDRCMELDHLMRPQSVFALQKALIENVPLQDASPGLIKKLKKYFT